MVKIASKKQIKDIELVALSNRLQIRTWHAFGISIISLTEDEALQLRDEIDEWVAEKPKTKTSLTG
ncbi:MAG: hypothetical protein ACYCQJ_02460 [Nitrososphaerales archaeon]